MWRCAETIPEGVLPDIRGLLGEIADIEKTLSLKQQALSLAIRSVIAAKGYDLREWALSLEEGQDLQIVLHRKESDGGRMA